MELGRLELLIQITRSRTSWCRRGPVLAPTRLCPVRPIQAAEGSFIPPEPTHTL